ncbi:hypothetical protein B9Z55_018703 [Caenorhabditis nigoni]|nr:hypothetical protein B9Z55_018703 [Caenorhabditis nigoni]
MHYFNRTYFEKETDQWPMISLIFKIEIPLIVFNILHTWLFHWINLKSVQFHNNWASIMSILYIQHIVADCAWIGQRVLLIQDSFTDPFESDLFIRLSYIRAFCLFLGLSILPCLIIERIYATIHISDYESKLRAHIFYTLLCLLTIIGSITSYTYHKYESSLAIFTFITISSSLGIMGNIILLNLNLRYYDERSEACLKTRYQITENIKVCRLVNGIVFSMGGFNGLMCITIITDKFNLSTYTSSLSMFAFDISAIIYSTVFPYVCMHYCKNWKATFLKLIAKFTRQRRSVQPYTTPESINKAGLTLKNTKGEVMSEYTTDVYFQQLKLSWA